MLNTEIRHFHLFCGLGGGARGFNAGQARVGTQTARFRCLGGVDSDPKAIADFGRAAGTAGTVLDLFGRDQYVAFHKHEPPAAWREATSADIRRAAGNERPHIVFTSPPCKAFSGLLSEDKSKTAKYQALSHLALRGIWLALEAWGDDPPEFFLLENVPRIQNRGRYLLDQIRPLLESYGYVVAETTHDCGELGGLAQSRKRFLLVARHQEKVPPFLYEPQKRPLLGVGDILGRMPLPGDPAGGVMHRVPHLQWKTWVRLAFVEAGSDWRSLNKLEIENGYLRDYLIVPEYRSGYLGVNRWEDTVGTVAGRSTPSNGAFSIADPREFSGVHDGILGVRCWSEPSGTVTGNGRPMTGVFSVADPRFTHSCQWHDGQAYGVRRWDETTGTVAGQQGPGQGYYSVADPRPHSPGRLFSKYAVTRWDARTGTVIGGDDSGAYAVADPRTGLTRGRGDHYLTAAHYGVVPWTEPCGAVSAAAGHDNGKWSVADPRIAPGDAVPADALPAANDTLVAIIRALDGTWHRPFTTLELAALQGLVDPEENLELEGLSDSAWRERIGNAVPPPAAQAIAGVMGRTLLLAWSGETFVLDAMPLWVRKIAIATSVATNPI